MENDTNVGLQGVHALFLFINFVFVLDEGRLRPWGLGFVLFFYIPGLNQEL
jgi:hypothetical protein